eukprot:2789762-Amphidinium_carterae.1
MLYCKELLYNPSLKSIEAFRPVRKSDHETTWTTSIRKTIKLFLNGGSYFLDLFSKFGARLLKFSVLLLMAPTGGSQHHKGLGRACCLTCQFSSEAQTPMKT